MSPLTGWLEESLAKHGSRIALIEGTTRLTYDELNENTRTLAAELKGRLSSGRVAIHSDKSILSIQWILAVLRAGGAYIPIDSRMPAARKAELLKLAQPDLVVGPGSEKISLPEGPSGKALGGGAAYYMFTSGSTGLPKAVEISQAAAAAFAKWGAQHFQLGEEDRVLGLSPLHFDLSTFDIFSVLGAGSTLVVAPPALNTFPAQLSEVLERERITIFYCVPSLLRMLVSSGRLSERKLPKLRAVLCAGDVFPSEEARALHSLTGCRIFNLYGPTETNVCTAHEWSAATAGKETPIGTAVAGDQCWVIRDDSGVAAEGETGELVVSGPTLMNGYFNDEEGTRAAFLRLANGERGYKTGDLVKRGANGVLWFVGRRSGIIKSYGYRIHPAEVETAIKALPGIADCVVFGEAEPRAGQILHALVVLRDPAHPAPEAGDLISVLPSPMIPSKFTVVSALPYLSNGKVDRESAAKFAEPKLARTRTRRLRWPAAILLVLAMAVSAKLYFHVHKSGKVFFHYPTGQVEKVVEWKNGKRNGISRGYYTLGQLRDECNFLEDERNGTCRVWYPTGKLKTESQFFRGKPEGVWREWYPGTDRLLSEERFRDGKKDGVQTFYYLFGPKREVQYFSRGLPEGNWITWYGSGKKKSEGTFQEGKEQGDWKRWSEGGLLTFSQQFRAGKPHGASRTFYESGRIHDECIYVDGRRDGYCRVYFPSGKIKSEERYVAGKRDGELRGWTESGMLTFSAGFRDDKLEGLKSAWDPHGRLIAQEEYQSGKILRVIKKNESGISLDTELPAAPNQN